MTTRNRHACVQTLFDSLARQRRRNFRLVAGLQTPDAEMLALVERYSGAFPLHAVVLPELGLSAARNRLLPMLQARLAAFPDDDCAYAPDAMAAVEDFFAAHPDMDGCVGAPASPKPDAPPRDGGARPVSRFGIFRNAPSWLLFFRSSAVRRVGEFDETLGTGADSPFQSGEETDYALRLLRLQGRIARCGSVRVQHPPPDFSRTTWGKWRSYGVGRMELLRRHAFPLWFQLANLLFPLSRMTHEPISRMGARSAMFCGRLRAFVDGMTRAGLP